MLPVAGRVRFGLELPGLLFAMAGAVGLGLGAAGRELLLGWIFA
ncbi:hypothetical protein [Cohnella thailandensis]|nr:hypothetical protein [Cohnella thailandensis]MBP1976674.1 hypothetical protein [Cohnella thailandensis]